MFQFAQSRYPRMLPAVLIGSYLILVPAHAQPLLLPQNPDVVAGDIAISTPNATGLQIDQTSASGIINWGGFSIADGHSVTFDNGAGATLNRVTGTGQSLINGQLTATGSLFLINQNGVVFGETGQVIVGQDFVASSLDVFDSDFLNGGDLDFSGASDGFVLNLGEISSLGGDVALIARSVRNQGTLQAENGTVALVAGREVLMRDKTLDDGRFLVRVGGADTDVEEAGLIRAANAELRANGGNVYALAGNTQGSIQASSVTKSGGRIFLTAGSGGRVNVAKTIKAKQGDTGGHITVTGSEIEATGLIDASGLTKGGTALLVADAEMRFSGEVLTFGDRETGNGGYAEVSGHQHLTFTGTVDTGGGLTRIDPEDVEITSAAPTLIGASTIAPDALASVLSGGSVVVDTAGGSDGSGTIAITQDLEYNSANSLTFLAEGDIRIEANVTNSSTNGGDIVFVAGWDGVSAFDPADFSDADFQQLADQSVFGNVTDALYEFTNEQSFTTSGWVIVHAPDLLSVSAGSRSGTTGVYANFVSVVGNDEIETGGFSQLGYRNDGFDNTSITGDIVIRATNDVEVFASTSNGQTLLKHAQIGHSAELIDSGDDFESFDQNISMSGDIDILAIGDMNIVGGSSEGYALIGHGTNNSSFLSTVAGSRSGDISIDITGEVSIEDGTPAGDGNSAWIGHSATSSNDIDQNLLVITAGTLDDTTDSSIASDGNSFISADILDAGLEVANVVIETRDSNFIFTEAVSSDFANDLSVFTFQDIIIGEGGGFEFANGGHITLDASGNFHNDSGSLAPFVVGEGSGWQVFSTRPDLNRQDIEIDGVDFLDFGSDFETLPNGNGFAYSAAPVVTATALDQSVAYGSGLDAGAGSIALVLAGSDTVLNASEWGVDLSNFGVDVELSETSFPTSSSGNIAVGSYTDAIAAILIESGPNGNEDIITLSGLTNAVIDGDLTVTPLDLVGTASALNKVYDATTQATVSFTTNILEEDDVSFEQTASFSDKNVGTGKTVTIDVTGLSGVDAGNYGFNTSFEATADITPRSLEITAVASDKVYDATTQASVAFTTNALAGDTLGVLASSDFDDKIVGNEKDVLIDFTGLTGTDAGNYIFNGDFAATASITPLSLDVGLEALDKVYDGTQDATIVFSSDALAGDDITINQVAFFEDKNAGFDKTVNVEVTGLTGTDAGNYEIATAFETTADITPLPLGITVEAQGKVYDGDTDATVSVTTNALNGDDVSVVQTASFSDKNVGTDKIVTVDVTALNGADSGNYSVIQGQGAPAIQGLADITPRMLNIDVTVDDKSFDGSSDAEVTFTDNRIDGDDLVLTGTGTFTDPAVGEDKSVTISNFNITGTDVSNYQITGAGTLSTTATIEPDGTQEIEPAVPQIIIAKAPELEPKELPQTNTETAVLYSNSVTETIVFELNGASEFCRQIGEAEYLVDCLGDRLAEIAAKLPSNGAYADSNAALANAAQKLAALVRQNASDALPPLQLATRSLGGNASTTLRAVRSDAMATVNAQARAILEEAETILLRSAENSQRRQLHHARIARAVGSTKLLLRSS